MTRKEEEPTLLTNPFWAYDKAVAALVACGVGNPPEPVPVVFAGKRKEFAGQDAPPRDASGVLTPKDHFSQTVGEPILSVRRFGNYIFDLTRFNTGRDQPLYLREDRKAWKFAPYPLPYIFLYQVDLRAKLRGTFNQIILAEMLKFRRPLVPMPVEWGAPYGRRNVEVGLRESKDTSVLEATAPDDERRLRHTFTLIVVGWLLGQIYEVPSVLSIETKWELVTLSDPSTSKPLVFALAGVERQTANPWTGDVTVTVGKE
jgi:hypothetical protein